MGYLWLLNSLLVASVSVPEAVRVSIAWSDAERVVSASEQVRREIESILGASGVEVDWRTNVERSRDAARDRVTVVITSSSPSGAGWKLKPTAMGAYLDAGASSAVFIFHERVRAAIGLPAAGERLLAPPETRAMTRALARVIVHELVHRVAPSQPHTPTGVMKGELDHHALTRPTLLLDPDSSRALARALAPAAEKRASR